MILETVDSVVILMSSPLEGKTMNFLSQAPLSCLKKKKKKSCSRQCVMKVRDEGTHQGESSMLPGVWSVPVGG